MMDPRLNHCLKRFVYEFCTCLVPTEARILHRIYWIELQVLVNFFVGLRAELRASARVASALNH